MPTKLVVDNKNYLPSTQLAGRFSYTTDYLGKLAREGKIDGTKVGRQWYINEASLQKFVAAVTEAKALRSDSLREQRIIERQQFTETQSEPDAVTLSNTPSKRNSISKSTSVEVEKPRLVSSTLHTMAQSTAVMMCGLLVGTLGFVVHQEELNLVSFTGAAQSFSGEIASHLVPVAPSSSLDQLALLNVSDFWQRFLSMFTVETKVLVEDESIKKNTVAIAETKPERSALLMLDKRTTTTTVAEIRNSFSDEVAVEFDGPDTGILKPIFKKKTDEAYRFLLVPVAEAVTK